MHAYLHPGPPGHTHAKPLARYIRSFRSLDADPDPPRAGDTLSLMHAAYGEGRAGPALDHNLLKS